MANRTYSEHVGEKRHERGSRGERSRLYRTSAPTIHRLPSSFISALGLLAMASATIPETPAIAGARTQCEYPFQLLTQLKESHAAGRRPIVDDHVERTDLPAMPGTPEYLASPAFETMSADCVANLAAGSDSETGRTDSVGVEVKSQCRATPLTATAIAQQIILTASQPMETAETFFEPGFGSAHAQALRRLRPLRRRRARIARPWRVRILARNPWVFLRRRLLG